MNFDAFKRLFGEVAAKYGFERAYGGWFIESPETMIVLDLQKSNYGEYSYLNIKIYVQSLFGNQYRREKKLVKTDVGDVFTRTPPQYDEIFNVDSLDDVSDRVEALDQLFNEYVQPIAKLAATRSGIFELERKGQVYLLPAVKEALLMIEADY